MQQVGFEILDIPCVAVGRVRRDGGGRGDDRVGVRGDQGGNSITTNVEAKKDNRRSMQKDDQRSRTLDCPTNVDLV